MKYPKPSYYCSDGWEIVVPAESNKPAHFVIGDKLYTVTEDIKLRTGATGLGGMNDFTLEANRPYYVYAVANAWRPYLIGDVRDPSDGPAGYSHWTYVGSFATEVSTATIDGFHASNGTVIANDDIESETHTGDLTITEKTFGSCPVTATHIWMMAAHNGAGAEESYVRISGQNDADNTILVRCQKANITNYSFGWVPVFTEKTFWITLSDALTTGTAYFMGWKEDVNSWK